MTEKNNCFGCIFAVDARDHRHEGEQVKCKKAKELFDYDGWVDALPEAKCGEFQPFKGSEIEEPIKLLNAPKAEVEVCYSCKGKGLITLCIGDEMETVICRACGGEGEILL